MQKISEIEATILYHYLIEHLLVSNNIEKELEPLNIDAAFIDILSLLIDVDKEEDYFDEVMHNNMEKLFLYLSKNNDNYRKLYKKYHSYPKSGKGNFYINQLFLKYDSIENYAKNKSIIWKKDDIYESVSFDFIAYATLLSCSLEEYVNDQFQNFAFNELFLLFTHKLINQYPIIFKNKDIKLKIQSILMYNDMLDNPETEENFKDTFIKRNISDNEISEEEYHKKYHEFINDNKRLLRMFTNNKIYKESCNVMSYITSYQENIIYEALFKGGIIPKNALMLEPLVKKIKGLKNFEWTDKMKDNALNLLSDLRQVIGKDQVPMFNDCISYINSIKTLEQNNIDLTRNNPYILGKLLCIIIDVSKAIWNEQDIGNKSVYMALNDLFDAINGYKEFNDVDNLEETLNALIRVYPNVFTNEYVSERINELTNTLPKGKKYAKKIKKIQNKKKV